LVAGDRAVILGAWAAAARYLSAALELWPAGDPGRVEAEALLGRALRWTGKLTAEFLDARIAAARAPGRDDLVAEAEMAYAFYWWDRSRYELVDEHMHAALALVSDKPASPSKASILHQAAIRGLVAGDLATSKALAEEAAGMARESMARTVRALIALARGDVRAADEENKRILAQARAAADPQVLYPALALATRAALAAARRDEAEQLFAELTSGNPERQEAAPFPGIATVALVATELGPAPDWLAPREPVQTPWRAAAAAAARGDFAEAAEIYASMGARPDEADARLYAARTLAAQGQRSLADEHLRRALAFYREVGATAYLREAESLLAASA
jgi:hypothetical protein